MEQADRQSLFRGRVEGGVQGGIAEVRAGGVGEVARDPGLGARPSTIARSGSVAK